MKQFAMILWLLLSGTTMVIAQSTITDPFFLITYDYQKIHFEEMPSYLEKQCTDLRHRYTHAWVYSHVKTADADFYVIYGKMRVADESRPGASYEDVEEGDGLSVALRGSKCFVDQTDFFFEQKINPAHDATPISASNPLLAQIADDLLRRYVLAFGSKAEFLKKVSPNAIDGMSPIIKARFEKFKATR